MYSVLSYGHMAADGVRMDAYARAITRLVRPGSVVLDLGAGTGILSLLAARAGARKVHAVDINPAVLLVRDLARENGLADHVEVHHMSSFELSLPERADVILSDLRGSLPLNGEHLPLIKDARERLLAPGGTLVPAQDRLVAAVVESSKLGREIEHGMLGFARQGLEARAAHASITNTVFTEGNGELSATDRLSTAERWATLDYATLEPGQVIEGTVQLSATRAGHANAIAVWFETTIHDDLTYSTAPGHATVYSRTLLPLPGPTPVVAGERFTLTLRADERGQRWAWDTTISGIDGKVRARLRQASFLGVPTSPETLLRSATTFKPTRSTRGERTLRALQAMDGGHSVGEIVEGVMTETPLPRELVLSEVRDVVDRYGR